MSTALSNTLKGRQNQIQSSVATPQQLAKSALNKNMNTFIAVFNGDELRARNFLSKVFATANNNPEILDCTPDSLVAAAIKSATLNLDPNPYLGHTWFVPYRNNKKEGCPKEIQFQIGARGYKELANRSENVLFIRSDIVKENDFFKHSKTIIPRIENNIVIVEEELDHRPAQTNRGKAIAFYAEALIKKKDCLVKAHLVMSKEDALRYKGFAKTKIVWDQFEDEMCEKTVLKHFCKELPLSTEIQSEMLNDNAVLKHRTEGNQIIVEVSEPEINYQAISNGTETREQKDTEQEQREIDEQKKVAQQLKKQHQQPAKTQQTQNGNGNTEAKTSRDTKYYTQQIKEAKSFDQLIVIQDEIKTSGIRVANKEELYKLLNARMTEFAPPEEPKQQTNDQQTNNNAGVAQQANEVPPASESDYDLNDLENPELPDDFGDALGLEG